MLDDTYLVTEHLNAASPSELDRISDILSHEPAGYVDFLRQLGTGTYCDFLNIASPTDWLPDLTEEFREIESQYVDWFPNYGESDSPRFDDAHCIGRSIDGDYLVSKPGMPIHVFPRHDDSLYILNEGLRDPLDWKRCDVPRRDYVYHPPFRYFESDVDRSMVSMFTAGSHNIEDVRGRILDKLPSGPTREINDESDDGIATHLILLFPRSIQGRVQLTQSPGDRRVGIMISFDTNCRSTVDALIGHLAHDGFYVTSKDGK